MRKVFRLFVAFATLLILCGCSDIITTNPIGDIATDPSKIIKGKVVFSNQSSDPYAVVVESEDGIDQFNVTGNANVTRTYSVGRYKITLTQTDGYVIYATKHNATLDLTEAGATLCWDNKDVWWKK